MAFRRFFCVYQNDMDIKDLNIRREPASSQGCCSTNETGLMEARGQVERLYCRDVVVVAAGVTLHHHPESTQTGTNTCLCLLNEPSLC